MMNVNTITITIIDLIIIMKGFVANTGHVYSVRGICPETNDVLLGYFETRITKHRVPPLRT